MKTKIITFVIILISIVSCKQNETKNVQITEQIPTVESRAETGIKDPAIVNSEQFIENDNLQKLLYSELEKLTENRTFSGQKEPINNRHIDNLVDTIITLKSDKIEINSYKAVSEEWIFKAEIRSPEVKFLDSVKIGMTKKTLERILKRELKSDLIEVGNLEQTSVFIFEFENGILKEIRYDGYLD